MGTTSKDHSVRPYAVSAVVLLTILTIAILLPDYWDHQLRLEQLKISQAERAEAAKNKQQATPASPAAPTATQPTPVDVPIAKKDSESERIGGEKIFETYGKLITMLLGFVSILGVFVGYFVRKSLREIQDDVCADVEKRMKLWELEKDMVLKSLTETRQKFDSLTELYAECRRVLDTLKEAANAELAVRKPTETSTDTIAASVDADPALNTQPNVTAE